MKIWPAVNHANVPGQGNQFVYILFANFLPHSTTLSQKYKQQVTQ